ncbi:hypothetical protein GRK80_002470 [Salmonella enterica]|nr:hypothetical protein [Salmonella enterica]
MASRAISDSSVNRHNWRLRTNGSHCYPVGTGREYIDGSAGSFTQRDRSAAGACL